MRSREPLGDALRALRRARAALDPDARRRLDDALFRAERALAREVSGSPLAYLPTEEAPRRRWFP